MDIKHWLNRPSEHLNIYLIVFWAVPEETAVGDHDAEILREAAEVLRNLQLKTSQAAMSKGPTGRFEWHDLVSEDVRGGIPKQVVRHQAWVFLVHGCG